MSETNVTEACMYQAMPSFTTYTSMDYRELESVWDTPKLQGKQDTQTTRHCSNLLASI